ncbi:menaquinone biosynthesis decarboxylase [Campylobacter jejuni]|uniref:Menaquinone biosynthesis decarboxylase n=5 Tax=Campylobacter jejuni TaxID=197 RepID=A0A5T1W576_CAMJU|nr:MULTISPECIES: menaquinone biosynthesis decarboxylase [Campylobacter]APA80828.1 UbiD family decarboxylase associated with menaquinone via futalosine [Campylobacter jejuni subsp. jejuni D42a]EAI0950672.1 menaquinone biosynthesis decarboxylase [Campylobacter coli]EAI3655511.1 menaquinone biosynthesis decarboxylase [Campylobacter fetus]AGV47427.1 3-octaprenyl-4-hydroxybenzoate carboxy-lyase [Campylobacter jejuni subsp. jejuni 00-2544]AGV49189.1 3-octaprenyl-4-hydroxybenzoate carboxy-lyase [Camp
MKEFIQILKENDLLRVIEEPVDVDLEIAHLAYIEAKKGEKGKALLFKNPIDKKLNKQYKFPVLMNTFCNKKALNLAFGRDYEEVAEEISKLIKLHIPTSFKAKMDFFMNLLSFKNIPPKRLKKNKALYDYEILNSLEELPILKTWEDDAGKFITMGQVYTQNLDKTQNNLGMYRLQMSDKNELLMHWQIHKDGANFYHEYKNAGFKKMPVSIAIGGDPLYIWCSQAPLPKGIFELLLYGFIKKTPAKITPCENGIFIPYDSDVVIEGYVDLEEFKIEGPFGDHTGFYTPAELFPVMKVEKIYAKKDAIYQATVVGKPPLEDKIMGLGTERIFLPLLQTSVPDLIDYNMPENGVFHNLILAKIDAKYPAHAQQIMHAFWGVGQMSFVKHAIFVDKNAPSLKDYDALIPYMLDRFNTKKILISEGICDQLDHASPNSCFGGKAGLDACEEIQVEELEILEDEKLLELFKTKVELLNLKQFYKESKSPIVCILLDKKEKIEQSFDKLLEFKKHFRILVFLDAENKLENSYMLVWRVVNNIDAKRDIFIKEERLGVDASAKGEAEGYLRAWPKQTDCTKSVIEDLILRNILENNPDLFNKFEIF